jgi:hypothetical protein
MTDYLFLADFFAGGGAPAAGAPAGGSLCSDTLATVNIWTCWLAAEVG